MVMTTVMMILLTMMKLAQTAVSCSSSSNYKMKNRQ